MRLHSLDTSFEYIIIVDVAELLQMEGAINSLLGSEWLSFIAGY